MYKHEFVRATPESVGIPSEKIQGMIQRMEESVTEMHGFMMAKDGKVISECWWAPYDKDVVHICHSFGKSYACTGIGLACTDGLLSVDDYIVDIFADEIKEYGIQVSENLQKIKVKHVLSMTNGMDQMPKAGPEFVKNYLSAKVDNEPGSVWFYNTTGSCLLVAIVEKVTGMGIREYMTRRVFDKIGIESDKLGWQKFRDGGTYAATGVSSTTENNLRLGMLFLNLGMWDGEQILDSEWVKAATTKQADNDRHGNGPNNAAGVNATAGYGYQLWMNKVPGVYRFEGGHGQFSIMSPRHNIVVSTNASAVHDCDMNAIIDIVDELFEADYPAALPENPAAVQKLREFEKTRRLSGQEKGELPAGYCSWEGIYRVTEGGFHLNPELRPWHSFNAYCVDFYPRDNVDVQTLSLKFLSDSRCEMVLDGKYRFIIRLDGGIEIVHTGSDYPSYYTTLSTGVFEEESFVIHTRYLQTAFRAVVWLSRTEKGLKIKVRKEMLHEGSMYFYLEAEAEKIL